MFRSLFSTGTARRLARRRHQLQQRADGRGAQHLVSTQAADADADAAHHPLLVQVRHSGALKGRTLLCHYPRDLLYSGAVLRRKHYARAQPHQQRRSAG